MEVSFTVEGKPQGKGRPRFARQGRFVRAYTPKNTASYEELIRWAFRTHQNGFYADKGTEIYIYITAYYNVPKTATRRFKQDILAGAKPTTKPDADNIAKVVCDALNGLAYYDDNQIVHMEISKEYGEPHLKITLKTK